MGNKADAIGMQITCRDVIRVSVEGNKIDNRDAHCRVRELECREPDSHQGYATSCQRNSKVSAASVQGHKAGWLHRSRCSLSWMVEESYTNVMPAGMSKELEDIFGKR